MSGNGETSVINRKNYPSLPEPAGPYSVSVRHNGTLYLSGMTAFGTPAQGKDIARQAEAIFEQIKRVTQAEGIGMRDLIKVTIFVTSMDEVGALREVLSKNYGGAYPASSLVRVAGLFSPEVNIEIEAVFAVPG
ncbi:enamine deaminase RidA [Pseudomonas chlororaphis]|nr:enamine deaminase RidA [Pseudomonas chlororaphis]